MEISKALIILACAYLGIADAFRINIGSCHKLKAIKSANDTAIWKKIKSRKPDAYIWGGDNIYGDQMDFSQVWVDGGHYQPASVATLIDQYKKTENLPEYKEFVEYIGQQNIHGIWDDHDYGLNNAGVEYPYRDESQQAFLDFFKVPEDSPRRRRKGVYHSTYLNDGAVKLILIDNRYHKDSYLNRSGDFLGEEQWKWLEEELNTMPSTVEITLIVSGLQMLADDGLRSMVGESWRKLPFARQRLLDLITSSKVVRPILISGDVHYAEMNMMTCNKASGKQYSLPELTTSGMTHSWRSYPKVGQFIIQVVQQVSRSPYQVKGVYYLNRNFGEIDIEKDKIHLKIFKATGELFYVKSFGFDDLKQGSDQSTNCQPIHPQLKVERYLRGLFTVLIIVFVIAVLPLTVLHTLWRAARS